MPLVTDIDIAIQANLKGAGDLNTPTSNLNYKAGFSLADGTGADQANNIFSDQRTLGAGSFEDLDLSGSLQNAFGATLNFTAVKAILVAASGGNTDNVEVGGAAVNGLNDWVGAAGDLVVVRPGGFLAIGAADATAYTVTAGTGDLLRINNPGAGAATYDIVIVGVA